MEFHGSGVFYTPFYKKVLVQNYSYPKLVINGKAFAGNYSLQSVLVLAYKASAHRYRDLGPFILGISLQVFEVGGLPGMHFSLEHFPEIFNGLRSGLWLGHARTSTSMLQQYVWGHCPVGRSSTI